MANQGNKGQGGKGQGNKNQGGKKQAPKKQGGKKQGPKNQGPKNQGPKQQTAPAPQPPNNVLSTPPPKKQGGKKQGNKQGGKKQGNKNQGNKQTNQQNTGDTTAANTTPSLSSIDYLNNYISNPSNENLAAVLKSFDTTPVTESLTAGQQQAANTFSQLLDQTNELQLAQADNQTRIQLGAQNLQGVQAQADATKFASSEQAGATKFASQQAAEAEKFSSVQSAEATKFAATEQARGSIETERVRSESLERQIGLQGEETRKTDLQSELFRRFKEAKDQLDALKAFKA